MPGRKKYEKLRARIAANPDPTPERRKRVEHLTAAYDAVVGLAGLRRGRGMTQTSAAREMGVSQPAVSQLEEATDLHLSTLSHYAEALGGRLEVTVVFPDGERETLMAKRRHRGS